MYNKAGDLVYEGAVDPETGKYNGHGRSFYAQSQRQFIQEGDEGHAVKFEGNFLQGKMHGDGR